MCYSLWYNAPTMLSAGHRPTTSWVLYITSCNTQSSAPENGRDHRPKHVELIGIINKPLLLHLFGVCIIYVSDARSNKYQTLNSFYSHCAPYTKNISSLSLFMVRTLGDVNHFCITEAICD